MELLTHVYEASCNISCMQMSHHQLCILEMTLNTEVYQTSHYNREVCRLTAHRKLLQYTVYNAKHWFYPTKRIIIFKSMFSQMFVFFSRKKKVARISICFSRLNNPKWHLVDNILLKHPWYDFVVLWVTVPPPSHLCFVLCLGNFHIPSSLRPTLICNRSN